VLLDEPPELLFDRRALCRERVRGSVHDSQSIAS
jgi:hypothetical protein